mmetsp:Transcript_439/g.1089  ORF Transcript_439/g.1089 Transcript_439/m.1089 type:complete len:254 (-) Transcript_439:920-1681(-)
MPWRRTPNGRSGRCDTPIRSLAPTSASGSAAPPPPPLQLPPTRTWQRTRAHFPRTLRTRSALRYLRRSRYLPLPPPSLQCIWQPRSSARRRARCSPHSRANPPCSFDTCAASSVAARTTPHARMRRSSVSLTSLHARGAPSPMSWLNATSNSCAGSSQAVSHASSVILPADTTSGVAWRIADATACRTRKHTYWNGWGRRTRRWRCQCARTRHAFVTQRHTSGVPRVPPGVTGGDPRRRRRQPRRRGTSWSQR